MTRKMSISFMAVAALMVGIGLVIAEARAPQHAARLENIPPGAPLADPLENAPRGVPLVLIARCEGAQVQLVAVPINGGDTIPIASFDAGVDPKAGPNCARTNIIRYFSVSVSSEHEAFLYRSNSTRSNSVAAPPYTSRSPSGTVRRALIGRVSGVWVDDTRVLYSIPPERFDCDVCGVLPYSLGSEWRSFDLETGEDRSFLGKESPVTWVVALRGDDNVIWARMNNAAALELFSSARRDLHHYWDSSTRAAEKHSMLSPVGEFADPNFLSPSSPMMLSPDGYRLALHHVGGSNRCSVAIVDFRIDLVEELDHGCLPYGGGLAWDGPDRLFWNQATFVESGPTATRLAWNSVVVSDLTLGTTTTVVRASESADYLLRDMIPGVGLLVIAREAPNRHEYAPTLDEYVLQLYGLDGSILAELYRDDDQIEVHGWIQLPEEE